MDMKNLRSGKTIAAVLLMTIVSIVVMLIILYT